MLPKSVIACLAASAFATGALMPTGASAAKGGPSQALGTGRPTLEAAAICPESYLQLCAGRALSS